MFGNNVIPHEAIDKQSIVISPHDKKPHIMNMQLHDSFFKVGALDLKKIEQAGLVWRYLCNEALVLLVNRDNETSLIGFHKQNARLMVCELTKDA